MRTNRRANLMLTPSQWRVVSYLQEGIATSDVVTLEGPAGAGKSAILRALQTVTGGALVEIRALCSLEEGLRMIEEKMVSSRIVIVDDFHLFRVDDRERSYILDAALTVTLGEAGAAGNKLVFGIDGMAPWPIARRAYVCRTEDDLIVSEIPC